jgi:hypothetical protein
MPQHIFKHIDSGDHVCSICKQSAEDCIDIKKNSYTECLGRNVAQGDAFDRTLDEILMRQDIQEMLEVDRLEFEE